MPLLTEARATDLQMWRNKNYMVREVTPYLVKYRVEPKALPLLAQVVDPYSDFDRMVLDCAERLFVGPLEELWKTLAYCARNGSQTKLRAQQRLAELNTSAAA